MAYTSRFPQPLTPGGMCQRREGRTINLVHLARRTLREAMTSFVALYLDRTSPLQSRLPPVRRGTTIGRCSHQRLDRRNVESRYMNIGRDVEIVLCDVDLSLLSQAAPRLGVCISTTRRRHLWLRPPGDWLRHIDQRSPSGNVWNPEQLTP